MGDLFACLTVFLLHHRFDSDGGGTIFLIETASRPRNMPCAGFVSTALMNLGGLKSESGRALREGKALPYFFGGLPAGALARAEKPLLLRIPRLPADFSPIPWILR